MNYLELQNAGELLAELNHCMTMQVLSLQPKLSWGTGRTDMTRVLDSLPVTGLKWQTDVKDWSS